MGSPVAEPRTGKAAVVASVLRKQPKLSPFRQHRSPSSSSPSSSSANNVTLISPHDPASMVEASAEAARLQLQEEEEEAEEERKRKGSSGKEGGGGREGRTEPGPLMKVSREVSFLGSFPLFLGIFILIGASFGRL